MRFNAETRRETVSAVLEKNILTVADGFGHVQVRRAPS